jgi:glycosyltransferase involved in cell wall biosynthesis
MSGDEIISVIIPTYNSAEYLPGAVESIRKQTVPPQEIIIVDDGSTDHTKQVVEKFKNDITYIHQKNSGPASARNRALKEVKGNYITFLDADDLWHPQKLENQIGKFRKINDLGITLGFSFQDEFRSISDINPVKAKLHAKFILLLGSGLIKRSVFEEVGNFDEDLIIGDDTDWFIRAREKGILISIQRELVLYYRSHNESLMKKRDVYRRSVFQLLKKAKDRRSKSEVSLPSMMGKPVNQDDLIEMWNTV